MEEQAGESNTAHSQTAVRSVRSRAVFPGVFFSLRPWLTRVAAILAIIWIYLMVSQYLEKPIVNEQDEDLLISYFSTELLVSEQGSTHSEPERWLAGTERPEIVERRAIRYLEKAKNMEMLGERGLTMLACLYWRQSDEASCKKLMDDLPAYEADNTWMIKSLLKGEALEKGEWQFLQRQIEAGTDAWVPFFIVQQAAEMEGHTGLPEGMQVTLDNQKQDLLVTQAMLNTGTWVLFALGIVCCVTLIRRYGLRAMFCLSQDHRLTHPDGLRVRAGLPMLWLLSIGVIVFVIGEVTSEILYSNLWASTPENVSVAGWWLRLFLYDLIFRIIGVTFLVWILFGRVGFAWRTFFHPVPKLSYWVLAAMSITWGLDLLIYAMPDTWFPVDPTQMINPEEYGQMGLLYALFSAVILAPICEEIIFRGLLFNVLKNKLGVRAGMVISSLIFASIHYYGIQDLLAVFVFGVVMAWLYHKTNSLIPCVLCHALYNLVITLWIWIMHQSGGGAW